MIYTLTLASIGSALVSPALRLLHASASSIMRGSALRRCSSMSRRCWLASPVEGEWWNFWTRMRVGWGGDEDGIDEQACQRDGVGGIGDRGPIKEKNKKITSVWNVFFCQQTRVLVPACVHAYIFVCRPAMRGEREKRRRADGDKSRETARMKQERTQRERPSKISCFGSTTGCLSVCEVKQTTCLTTNAPKQKQKSQPL